MSSNFAGLLIILLALLTSTNIVMAMRNEPLLLAWLNQLFIGTILVAILSYAVVWFTTRKVDAKVKEPKKEEHK